MVDSQGLTLAGLVSTGTAGLVDITTSLGGLTQLSGGTLVTGTLTSNGNVFGATSLKGSLNAIGTIAGFTSGGTLAVVDNQPLTLAGVVSVGSAGTVDITTTASGGINQSTSGTLIAGTLTSTGGIASSMSLAGTANAIGSIGSIAVAGANSTFTLNDATNLTLNGTLSAHQIVVTDTLRTVTLANGAKILTDGGARPNGAIATNNLPFNQPFTPANQGGAYFSAQTVQQNGVLSVGNLYGTSNVLRIDTTAATQFDTGSGLNGPNTWLILGLNNAANATGAIVVNTLDVTYSGGIGSANLSGSIKGLTGQGAAGAGHIQPAANAHYKMNACPIASVNCVIVTGEPLKLTLPDFVEPTFLVPDVGEDQDFLPLAVSDRDY